MKLVLYVTKDSLANEAVSGISMYKNDALAKRNFKNAIEQICLAGNPDKVPVRDLQLHKVGEFDTETLKITPCEEHVANAAEFVIDKQKNENKGE